MHNQYHRRRNEFLVGGATALAIDKYPLGGYGDVHPQKITFNLVSSDSLGDSTN